jgi:hypothetical protein
MIVDAEPPDTLGPLGADLVWLFVFAASWAAPIVIDEVAGVRYWHSLLIWAIPIAYLLPLFLRITDPGAIRRRALWWSVGGITGLGIVLDFLVGGHVLVFQCEIPGMYLACLPGNGIRVPVEEVLFYLMAPIAMVLVYACCDAYWLADPDAQMRRHNWGAGSLVRVRWSLVAIIGLCVAVAVVFYLATGRVASYFLFLTVSAIGPAALLYNALRHRVNWRAFALTTIYLVGTALMWEVTLAIPRAWWGYRHEQMLWTITAWSAGERILPVEAVLVWICAPFSAILTFEFARAVMFRRQSS